MGLILEPPSPSHLFPGAFGDGFGFGDVCGQGARTKKNVDGGLCALARGFRRGPAGAEGPHPRAPAAGGL